jgi:phosphoribosyl 1,2-cyclic phosphodiesterase
MSLSLSILASGSSGNCSVLRSPRGVVLIDCGIGPRTTAGRMKDLGVCVADVRAICLTHLDSDHFNRVWVSQIIRNEITVFCHENRIDELVILAGGSPEFAGRVQPFNGHPFEPVPGAELSAIRLHHDEEGSHGFLAESSGIRIGYATDLGHVEERLIRHFAGVGLLAIESNYDPQMQLSSDRPWFLKRRIMGGKGHLSNEQALAAVRKILDQAEIIGRALPRHIVLLHRSRQCNCPHRVRELFSSDDRIADRLVLAEQDRATPWLSAADTLQFAQMELQWS